MTSALHKHIFFVNHNSSLDISQQEETNPRHFNIYNLPRSFVGATLVQEVQPFSLSLLGCNFSWKHFNSISVANIRTSVGRGRGSHVEIADRKIQWWWLSSRKSQHMDFNQLTPKKKNIRKNPCEFNISLLYTWICIDLNDAKITGRADLTIPACPGHRRAYGLRSFFILWQEFGNLSPQNHPRFA